MRLAGLLVKSSAGTNDCDFYNGGCKNIDAALRVVARPLRLAELLGSDNETAATIFFGHVATVYRSERFISIEALSGASALAYREDNGHRIYLVPEATNEILGRALLAAFDKSRYVDPSSEREFYKPGRTTCLYKECSRSLSHAMATNRSVPR